MSQWNVFVTVEQRYELVVHADDQNSAEERAGRIIAGAPLIHGEDYYEATPERTWDSRRVEEVTP